MLSCRPNLSAPKIAATALATKGENISQLGEPLRLPQQTLSKEGSKSITFLEHLCETSLWEIPLEYPNNTFWWDTILGLRSLQINSVVWQSFFGLCTLCTLCTCKEHWEPLPLWHCRLALRLILYYVGIDPMIIARSVEVMHHELQILKRMCMDNSHLSSISFDYWFGSCWMFDHFCAERLCVATQFDLPLCTCPSQGALADKHLGLQVNLRLGDMKTEKSWTSWQKRISLLSSSHLKIGRLRLVKLVASKKHKKHCPFKPLCMYSCIKSPTFTSPRGQATVVNA